MIKNFIKIVRKKPWLSLIILIYTAGMIAVSIPKSMEISEDTDFNMIFWNSGKDFSDGHELYYRKEHRPFLHPPFAAFVFQPLHLLPLKISALVFFLVNSLILLPLAIYLIYKMLRLMNLDEKKIEISLILATIMTLQYFWNNLVMFNINYYLFDVILIGFYFLARQKPHIAGILFTILTFIKIIPVLLAGYVFLFHFSRKVFISMALTVMICLTLPAAFRGMDLWVQDHIDHYETVIKDYIIDGRMVCEFHNHNLKAGIMKMFHPETRGDIWVYSRDYPATGKMIILIQLLFLGILIFNGIILFKRKVYFSIAYLASIQLFTHLVSGLTWAAHLVTMIFCLMPLLLIDVKKLKKPGRITYYISIAFFLLLGIEGSDTTGQAIYNAIRFYDIFTFMLISLFLFYSWMVWKKQTPMLTQSGPSRKYGLSATPS